MFEVHCHELIHALVKRAEGLRKKLVTRLLKDHQDCNEKSVSAFTSLLETNAQFTANGCKRMCYYQGITANGRATDHERTRSAYFL